MTTLGNTQRTKDIEKNKTNGTRREKIKMNNEALIPCLKHLIDTWKKKSDKENLSSDKNNMDLN